jgi:signal transduction histidine kinase
MRAAEKARLVEDLARREEQIRHLSEHMMQVEEEERRRISRELHDEAGQSLLCIRLKLEMMGMTAPENLRGPITETRELTEQTIAGIRRTIAALSPALLEQLGLAAALRQMAHRFRDIYPGRVRLHLPARRDPFPRECETAAFRLAQECFHNIAKHARASTVNLSLESSDGILRLNVEDDGVGFDMNAARGKKRLPWPGRYAGEGSAAGWKTRDPQPSERRHPDFCRASYPYASPERTRGGSHRER